MKRIALSILLVFCIANICHAQFTLRKRMTQHIPADSTDIAYYSQKNFRNAALGVFTINMGVWTFDRYIQNADFAKISMNTIRNNFKHGFIWDNDQMSTNMFLHPYHGNLYFNTARGNGYNFWESGLFALGGSAMWELFMESELPSTNDIIATPIGGMVLGEVFYRASDVILDDRSRGKARFGRELAAFVVSPMRGLTRIINGDAWRKRPTSGRQFGIPNVSFEISAGVRALELEGEIFDKGVGLATSVSLEYGDRYASESERPFDYFTLQADVNIQASQPAIGQINIAGRLFTTEVIDTKKDFLSFGFYQHFDYYDSDTISGVSNKIPYKFSTPASFGAGLIYQNKRFSNWQIDAYSEFNGILLGACVSDYYVVKDRDYNLNSGFSWRSGLNIAYRDKVVISYCTEGYRMFTWQGYPEDINWNDFDERTLDAQGDVSQSTILFNSLKVDLKLKNNLYLTGITRNFYRDTNYKHFNDASTSATEGKLMLTYKF